MRFLWQEYWHDLPFPPLVDHVLSELSIMMHPSWVALHSMAHLHWVTQAPSPWQGCDPWREYWNFTEFIYSKQLFGGVLGFLYTILGFPGSSVFKESACNAGDPASIPGLGRSPGERTGYPLQYSWSSLVAQLVKNLPAVWETWVQSHHLQRLTFLFLPYQFICFSYLIALVRTYNKILNKSGESKHFCPYLDLRGKSFSFSPLSMMLTVSLLYMIFIMLLIPYLFSTIPTLLRVLS